MKIYMFFENQSKTSFGDILPTVWHFVNSIIYTIQKKMNNSLIILNQIKT